MFLSDESNKVNDKKGYSILLRASEIALHNPIQIIVISRLYFKGVFIHLQKMQSAYSKLYWLGEYEIREEDQVFVITK